MNITYFGRAHKGEPWHEITEDDYCERRAEIEASCANDPEAMPIELMDGESVLAVENTTDS